MPTDSPDRAVWSDDRWLIFLQDDTLWSHLWSDARSCAAAASRLRDGEIPASVFGWASKRLAISAIRSVQWVPGFRVLLIWQGWWRDPWRISFTSEEEGRQVFERLAPLISDDPRPVKERIGPNDLAIDPAFAIGILLAFLGVVTLILGAVEGVRGELPQGPARKFAIFAILGDAIGVGPAFAVAGVAALGGIGGLIWWSRNRGEKWVVRRSRQTPG